MIPAPSSSPTRTSIAMSHGRAAMRGRAGFSLVEVVVAIALFGVSMAAIAGLTFAVTRQALATTGTVERTARLESRVNDLISIPWTALEARAGCTAQTGGIMPRTECITIETVSATRKNVTLTITPNDTDIAPTSVTVERTKPPASNPFRVMP